MVLVNSRLAVRLSGKWIWRQEKDDSGQSLNVHMVASHVAPTTCIDLSAD